MAAHGFNEAQMAYIENTIGIKIDQLQGNLREIATNAQIALDLAQSKLERLFTEATQNACRVDTQVREMNELKAAIEVKIAQYEAAIVASGQSADGAHSRLTIALSELDEFSGRTESLTPLSALGFTIARLIAPQGDTRVCGAGIDTTRSRKHRGLGGRFGACA